MKLRRRSPDQLSKLIALNMIGGRAAIGTAALLATRPALGALGFDGDNSSARVLGRMAGARDIALGVQMAASLEDAGALREAALTGIVADGADALIFAAATSKPELRKAALLSAPAAITAVVLAAILAKRLE